MEPLPKQMGFSCRTVRTGIVSRYTAGQTVLEKTKLATIKGCLRHSAAVMLRGTESERRRDTKCVVA